MARYDVPIPELPLGFMNDDHREELALMEAAAAALVAGDREALVAGLEALAEHTRAHFEREEEVMRTVRFPAYPAHKAEHDRVLAELASEATAWLEAGDAARLARGRLLRRVLKQEPLQPLPPECQLAWLIAFNDGRFEGMDEQALDAALRRLFAGATAGALTLEDARDSWSAAVAGWIRAEGA